jgi:hypothetical protein
VLAVVAVLVVACGSRVEDVTDVLTPSAAPTATPQPTAEPSPEPTAGAKPAIVVRTPRARDEVTSPVRIAGTADVFEATVSIRILGADGEELAATFATATCGSGCRGAYSEEVFFFTDRREAGTVEVFETSAEDGSPIHLVSVPVVLVPGA